MEDGWFVLVPYTFWVVVGMVVGGMTMMMVFAFTRYPRAVGVVGGVVMMMVFYLWRPALFPLSTFRVAYPTCRRAVEWDLAPGTPHPLVQHPATWCEEAQGWSVYARHLGKAPGYTTSRSAYREGLEAEGARASRKQSMEPPHLEDDQSLTGPGRPVVRGRRLLGDRSDRGAKRRTAMVHDG